MTKKIEDKTREQISRFLPDAIARALNSYHKFSQQPIKDSADEGKDGLDHKDFKEHHAACKVAVSHIELLIKLAKFADLPDAKLADGNQQIMLAALLQEAQEDIEGYKASEHTKV